MCTFDEEFAFLLNNGKDVCVVCYFAAQKNKKKDGALIFQWPKCQEFLSLIFI